MLWKKKSYTMGDNHITHLNVVLGKDVQHVMRKILEDVSTAVSNDDSYVQIVEGEPYL